MVNLLKDVGRGGSKHQPLDEEGVLRLQGLINAISNENLLDSDSMRSARMIMDEDTASSLVLGISRKVLVATLISLYFASYLIPLQLLSEDNVLLMTPSKFAMRMSKQIFKRVYSIPYCI